ncbi:LysE family transporter [Psychrobacter sp. B38]|uniref:LysE family translocator n=1 Tax=Psychrobacter sp. B38 TaxID=3143538 RepID=UPI00320C609C
MLEIFLYAIGIMYSPGPVNLLGLKSGMDNKVQSHIGFFLGVGSAMLILFLVLGYAGLTFIPASALPFISTAGCLYILYIAVKIAFANVTLGQEQTSKKSLSYANGLFIQLLNPKGLAATLPITTIQFPAANISGSAIFYISFILAILAVGAPASYALLGRTIGSRIENPKYFKWFNLVMAGLLVFVAIDIAHKQLFI